MALPVIRVALDEIDSTNNWAKASVLGGTTLNFPLVVTARCQSAGRGRHGHTFFSPKDSGLYMSYAFEKSYSTDELLGITTVAADVLLPVLQKHTLDELHIKPINDILKGPRKIAGILTERVDYPTRPGEYFIVIGIGINCFECEIPAEYDDLKDIIAWLEPDCSIDELEREITEALYQVFH